MPGMARNQYRAVRVFHDQIGKAADEEMIQPLRGICGSERDEIVLTLMQFFHHLSKHIAMAKADAALDPLPPQVVEACLEDAAPRELTRDESAPAFFRLLQKGIAKHCLWHNMQSGHFCPDSERDLACQPQRLLRKPEVPATKQDSIQTTSIRWDHKNGLFNRLQHTPRRGATKRTAQPSAARDQAEHD